MQIPVGTQASVVTRDTVGFRCGFCGERRRAEVIVVGTGVQSIFNARGTAARRARVDARVEIGRTIRFATCPACSKRSGYFRFLRRYLIVAAFFIALGIVCGYAPTWLDIHMKPSDKAGLAYWVPLTFTIATVVVTSLGVWWRWAANDRRVRWLDDEASSAGAG